MADDRPDLPDGVPSPAWAAELYDTDFLAWTARQAMALRAGDVASLDWSHLAEEVEDVGESVYRGCRSQVANIIEHLLKLEFVRSERDRPHWRGEIAGFRDELAAPLTTTLGRKLLADLDARHAFVIRRLLLRELPGFDRAAAEEARQRPYSWAQITDEDWYPEPRAD